MADAGVTGPEAGPQVSLLERRRRVAQARSDLQSSLRDVQAGVRSALDWRRQVRRHPVATGALIGGAGLLAVIAVLVGRRRRAPAVVVRQAPSTAAAVAERAAAPALGAAIASVLVSTALRKLGPMLVEHGVRLASDRMQRRMARRRASQPSPAPEVWDGEDGIG